MKRNRKRYLPSKCAVVADESGLAMRLMPDRKAAYNWLDKHRPGLDPETKRSLVKDLNSRKAASEEFDRQIRLGCADSDVLAMLTYFAGVSTPKGFDFKTFRPYGIVDE